VRASATDLTKERPSIHTLYTSHEAVYLIYMDSREIIRALTAAGWQHVATKGSHYQFKHPSRSGRVTVPHPKRDIPLGTLRSIEKQAGLTLRGGS
jgi:predicted RNA binding protein YcfA (HicA-like mRNA interferase family)